MPTIFIWHLTWLFQTQAKPLFPLFLSKKGEKSCPYCESRLIAWKTISLLEWTVLVSRNVLCLSDSWSDSSGFGCYIRGNAERRSSKMTLLISRCSNIPDEYSRIFVTFLWLLVALPSRFLRAHVIAKIILHSGNSVPNAFLEMIYICASFNLICATQLMHYSVAASGRSTQLEFTSR